MNKRNLIREIKERLAELEAAMQDVIAYEAGEMPRIDAERGVLVPIGAEDIESVLEELDKQSDCLSARAALIIRNLYERLQGEEIEEALRRR